MTPPAEQQTKQPGTIAADALRVWRDRFESDWGELSEESYEYLHEQMSTAILFAVSAERAAREAAAQALKTALDVAHDDCQRAERAEAEVATLAQRVEILEKVAGLAAEIASTKRAHWEHCDIHTCEHRQECECVCSCYMARLVAALASPPQETAP